MSHNDPKYKGKDPSLEARCWLGCLRSGEGCFGGRGFVNRWEEKGRCRMILKRQNRFLNLSSRLECFMKEERRREKNRLGWWYNPCTYLTFWKNGPEKPRYNPKSKVMIENWSVAHLDALQSQCSCDFKKLSLRVRKESKNHVKHALTWTIYWIVDQRPWRSCPPPLSLFPTTNTELSGSNITRNKNSLTFLMDTVGFSSVWA